MVRRKELTPGRLADIKHLYEETLAPVNDIIAMAGLSRSNFYERVKQWGWRRRHAGVGTFQFARAMVAGMADTAPSHAADRAALAGRIQAVVECEMDTVERILATLAPSDHATADHCARTLAYVSRTVREIAALNQPDQVNPPDEADDDPVPRDIDEFRFELARPIRAFVETSLE